MAELPPAFHAHTTPVGPVLQETLFVRCFVRSLLLAAHLPSQVQSQNVVGSISIRSFLAGNPPIVLGLNHSIVLPATETGPCGRDAVFLYSCTLHEMVRRNEWEQYRTLRFVPSQGEHVLMKYRVVQGIKPPLKVPWGL